MTSFVTIPFLLKIRGCLFETSDLDDEFFRLFVQIVQSSDPPFSQTLILNCNKGCPFKKIITVFLKSNFLRSQKKSPNSSPSVSHMFHLFNFFFNIASASRHKIKLFLKCVRLFHLFYRRSIDKRV